MKHLIWDCFGRWWKHPTTAYGIVGYQQFNKRRLKKARLSKWKLRPNGSSKRSVHPHHPISWRGVHPHPLKGSYTKRSIFLWMAFIRMMSFPLLRCVSRPTPKHLLHTLQIFLYLKAGTFFKNNYLFAGKQLLPFPCEFYTLKNCFHQSNFKI